MSTLRLTTLANQAGTISVPSDTIINGSAKAWVNFNGTGTVAIRAAFNVSSITDLGTGNYRANFTNPMTDSNYSAVCWDNGYGAGWIDVLAPSFTDFKRANGSWTPIDVAFCCLSVFR